jgi:hypothetical protein
VTGETPFVHQNRARQFRNILDREPVFPADFPPDIREYVTLTLEKDPVRRAKFEQLKECSLFRGLNWDDVLNRRIQPNSTPARAQGAHLNNFDEEFTQEPALDSVAVEVHGDEERVPGFSFLGDAVLPDGADGGAVPVPSILDLDPL